MGSIKSKLFEEDGNRLTENEIQKAFTIWRLRYYPFENDEFLEPFLYEKLVPYDKIKISWLRKVRNGLLLSTYTVAARLGISRVAYSKYEENEETGSISIATLAKAAKAMDCELVYAIRPKNKKLFSQIIWDKIFTKAKNSPRLMKRDQKRRENILAGIARNLMNDTQFRKLQNWNQHKNKRVP